MVEHNEKRRMVAAPRHFFMETLIGIAIFLIIACAAVLLSYLVKILEKNGVDMVIVTGLKITEYVIFFGDLILFGRFLWKAALKTWGKF